MTTETLVTKVIRPSTLFWITAMFSVLSVIDGNIGDFNVKDAYISVYETILVTIYAFYFLGRSGEKITKTIRGDNV